MQLKYIYYIYNIAQCIYYEYTVLNILQYTIIQILFISSKSSLNKVENLCFQSNEADFRRLLVGFKQKISAFRCSRPIYL